MNGLLDLSYMGPKLLASFTVHLFVLSSITHTVKKNHFPTREYAPHRQVYQHYQTQYFLHQNRDHGPPLPLAVVFAATATSVKEQFFRGDVCRIPPDLIIAAGLNFSPPFGLMMVMLRLVTFAAGGTSFSSHPGA